MSGKILIVDNVSAMRILLRAELTMAGYRVQLAPSLEAAEQAFTQTPPDLVLMSLDLAGAAPFLAQLRAQPAHGNVPVIGVLAPENRGRRLEMIHAGADDVLWRPAHNLMLLARIRSLLREQHQSQDLRPRGEAAQALGLAEAAVPDLRAPCVVILGQDRDYDALSRTMKRLINCAPRIFRDPLSSQTMPGPADLFLLDGRGLTQEALANGIYRKIPELRSNQALRHVKLLVLLDHNQAEAAIAALDLGADDAICGTVCTDEVAHRMTRLIQRKRLADRYRTTLHSGMVAAITDPLTGLYNRRFALTRLQALMEDPKTRSHAPSVLMVDLDHFKSINDRFGHATGDDVLVGLAERLTETAAPEQTIARLGGEEFLIILPSGPLERAVEIADRFRRHIAERPFHSSSSGHNVCLTASFGAAQARSGMTPAGLLDVADQALYRAKAAGRNKIELSAHTA